MNYGHAIRTMREKRGLSQTQMAKDVQVGRTYLVAVETGCKSPGLQLLQASAEVLNVPLLFLFALAHEGEDARGEQAVRRLISQTTNEADSVAKNLNGT